MLFDWYTSDWHLGHDNIITFCNRPFKSVKEMDKSLIENFNKVVESHHKVAMIGDMSFHGRKYTKELLSKLNGEKYLIRGNHDKWSDEFYLSCGFKLVMDEMRVSIRGAKTYISHFHPFETIEIPYKGNPRYIDSLPRIGLNSICIHGHLHVDWKYKGCQVHVGVDAWDYKPAPGAKIESAVESLHNKQVKENEVIK